MSNFKEIKPKFSHTYLSEEECDSYSSNQGEEDFSESSENPSESYTSTSDSEMTSDFDDGSDFSVDEILSFEPINPSTISTNYRALPKSTLANQVKTETVEFKNFVAAPKLERKPTGISLQANSVNNDRKPTRPLHLSQKIPPPPPPPPPPNKKVQLTRDEIKKLEIENDKSKNKFGFIRKEDFLFCCFTSAKTKTLRFFKRLIILEEGSILCHLTSSSPSYLYYTKDGSIYEDTSEKAGRTLSGNLEKQIKTLKYNHKYSKYRNRLLSGYEDEENDSDENFLINSNLDESSDENLIKSIKKSKHSHSRRSSRNNNNSSDSDEYDSKKYKYELIYLRNCLLSLILFDEADKKYFFHISSNNSPKKYFFLSDDLTSLYLWYLAIQSNIQNSEKFQSNTLSNEPGPVNPSAKPTVENSSSLTSSLLLFVDPASLQRTISHYSPNTAKQLSIPPPPPPPVPRNIFNEISTNYTCYSVTPPSPSPTVSPTPSPNPPRSKSPRRSPRTRVHRRHLSLTISPTLDQFPILPPHPSSKMKKHKKKKKIALSSPVSPNSNNSISPPPIVPESGNDSSKPSPASTLKQENLSQSDHTDNSKYEIVNNDNNVSNNNVKNIEKSIPTAVFDRKNEKYAADDEGDVKIPLKKPTPFFIVPFIKSTPNSSSSSYPISSKTVLHGFDVRDELNKNKSYSDRPESRTIPPADPYAKSSNWRKSLPPPPRSMSPSIPEIEEMDFSFLDKIKETK